MLAAAGAVPEPAGACSMPRSTQPLIYERFTESGRYVVAVVEPSEPYTQRFGYRPTDDDLRILATYPQSGLFRKDDPRVLILRIDWELPPSNIIALWDSGEGVHLVAMQAGGLSFFRNGTLVRHLGGHDVMQWIAAPWFYANVCGAGSPFEARFDETETRPRVSIVTAEGSKFHYDALNGLLVGVERAEFDGTDQAATVEEELSGLVAGLLQRGNAEKLEGLDSLWGDHFEGAWLEDCGMFLRNSRELDQTASRPVLPDESPASPDALSVRALEIEAHGGPRLRHRGESMFDLFRAPPGSGSILLCGGDILEATWLREELDRRLGADEAQGAWKRIELAFQGPTVAAITTRDADEIDEGIERTGIATLWSRATGQWRIVMMNRFIVPQNPVHLSR